MPSALQWQVIEHHEQIHQSGSGVRLTGKLVRISERAPVPGGWLVRTRVEDHALGRPPQGDSVALGAGAGVGLTFVPDPQHAWEL